jgi:hypothetical protein
MAIIEAVVAAPSSIVPNSMHLQKLSPFPIALVKQPFDLDMAMTLQVRAAESLGEWPNNNTSDRIVSTAKQVLRPTARLCE